MSVTRRFERMKKFVASVGAISLVSLGLLSSSPALAATASDSEMTSMRTRVAEMEATLASMSQQDGRPAQANSAWSKYIRTSGGINVDAKLAGTIGNNDNYYDSPVGESSFTSGDANKTSGRFTGENVKRFGVNDAYLNVDADVNNWVSARVGITYEAVSTNYTMGKSALDTNSAFHVDQAYATIADFDKEPYYLRAGLQYVDFGSYELHPITKSMVQELTELNDVAIQVGMLDISGINASAFFLETGLNKVDEEGTDLDVTRNRNQINWGITASYHGDMRDSAAYDLELGYLDNMVDVEGFQRFIATQAMGTPKTSYENKVPEMFIGAGVTSGPFSVKASYVTALRSFNEDDTVPVDFMVDEAAKPSAGRLEAEYTFKYFNNRDNTLGVSYDRSWEASPLGLPKDRYSVSYKVGLYQNTDFIVQWDHDNDYGTNKLVNSTVGTNEYASGRHYNVVTARLAVNFG
jgi:hypothetical protein